MTWWSKIFGGSGAPEPRTLATELIEAQSISGYEREAAVRVLASLQQPEAIPVLLLRANDWVPQVRAAAQVALKSFMTPAFINSWAKALDQVLALRRATRADHSPLLDELEAFLSQPDHLARLKLAQQGGSQAVCRWLLTSELKAACDDETRQRVVREALRSRDAHVARVAAEVMAGVGSIEGKGHLAVAACASPFAAVRLRGLRLAIQCQPPEWRALVRTLARDPQASVRAVALSLLGSDSAPLCTEMSLVFHNAAQAAARAVALDVLCALKADGAQALCDAAQADAAVVVRCVAYAWRISSVTAAEVEGLILKMLSDASPRVRRLATRFIRRGGAAPAVDRLLGVLTDHPFALGSVMSAATGLSPWSRLRILLEVLSRPEADSVLIEQLHRELGRWETDMLRCFVDPRPDESARLRLLWAPLCTRLPEDLRRRVGYQLQTFGVLG